MSAVALVGGGADRITTNASALVEKKKRYTFVLGDGTQRSFDDPDLAVDWYNNEADPSQILTDIIVAEAD